jgi:hypothetical protein
MKTSDENYNSEKGMIEHLSKICINHGLELMVFNMSEFEKSGAAISCCMLHLNYSDYKR